MPKRNSLKNIIMRHSDVLLLSSTNKSEVNNNPFILFSKLLSIRKLNLKESIKMFSKSKKFQNDIKNYDYGLLINTLINKLIKYFDNYIDENNKYLKLDKLLSHIIYILNNQSKDNPPYYISHGVDHSIRVMRYCLELYYSCSIFYKIFKEKYNKNNKNINEEKYNKNNKNIIEEKNKTYYEILIIFLGLFHDLGYSDIEKIKSKNNNTINKKLIPKFVHSYSSYKILYDENFSDIFINILTKEGFNDLINAIKNHNLDSINCKNHTNHTNKCEFISSINRHTDYIEAGLKVYRNYIEANIEDNPLLFLIRFTDNLDFSRDRLTKDQQEISLILLFRNIFEYSLEKKNTNSTRINDIVNKYLIDKRIINYYENNIIPIDEDKFKMINIAKKMNKEFLHYYSNWIVENINIRNIIIDDTDNFLINILFYDVIDKKYSELLFINNIYPALFQVERIYESYRTIFMNGTSIIDRVVISLNFNNNEKNNTIYFKLESLYSIILKLKEGHLLNNVKNIDNFIDIEYNNSIKNILAKNN